MLGSYGLTAFVATADAGRARAFYENVLGLRLAADEPFALVFDANGTTLRVSKVQSVAAAPYTVLGWDVADIAAVVGGLAARGVVFERFEGMAQDELGVWSSPGGAKVAWFRDPDGNLLSVTISSAPGQRERRLPNVFVPAPPVGAADPSDERSRQAPPFRERLATFANLSRPVPNRLSGHGTAGDTEEVPDLRLNRRPLRPGQNVVDDSLPDGFGVVDRRVHDRLQVAALFTVLGSELAVVR